MLQWLLTILPLAAIAGWWVGRQSSSKPANKTNTITRDYLQGINYLLNEQPDKAVELFVKMIEVDADTVETHLALGNLFRQRGEVDRAIRIHQSLIARTELAKKHRIQALVALGRDYMLAGVLDRAESLFLEVLETGEHINESLIYLLDIYQQEKDWEQAIITAHRLEGVSGDSMQKEIAHYYCELAIEARAKISSEQGQRYAKRALNADTQCVRASLLLGQWLVQDGHYRQAMRILQKIKSQDPAFLSEAFPSLLECAEQIQKEVELIEFLQGCLKENPTISIELLIADHLQQLQGLQVAVEFITAELQTNSSLQGVHRLIELQSEQADGNEKKKFKQLESFVGKLLVNKPSYQCTQCGYSGKVLHWHCPSCKLWSTTKPIGAVVNEETI